MWPFILAGGLAAALLFGKKSSRVSVSKKRSSKGRRSIWDAVPTENVLRWAPKMKSAIAAYHPALPLEVALATMHIESGGDPTLTSPVKAAGLMQLMPKTAKMFRVTDPYDPTQSIRGGVQTFKWIMPMFIGSDHYWERVLGGYNAGPYAIPKKGPGYTKRYEYYGPILRLVPMYKAELSKRGLL